MYAHQFHEKNCSFYIWNEELKNTLLYSHSSRPTIRSRIIVVTHTPPPILYDFSHARSFFVRNILISKLLSRCIYSHVWNNATLRHLCNTFRHCARKWNASLAEIHNIYARYHLFFIVRYSEWCSYNIEEILWNFVNYYILLKREYIWWVFKRTSLCITFYWTINVKLSEIVSAKTLKLRKAKFNEKIDSLSMRRYLLFTQVFP